MHWIFIEYNNSLFHIDMPPGFSSPTVAGWHASSTPTASARPIKVATPQERPPESLYFDPHQPTIGRFSYHGSPNPCPSRLRKPEPLPIPTDRIDPHGIPLLHIFHFDSGLTQQPADFFLQISPGYGISVRWLVAFFQRVRISNEVTKESLLLQAKRRLNGWVATPA
jgi:hypothetical protein